MYVMRSDVTIEVLSDAQCFASIDEPSDASHTLGSIQHTKSYVELGYGNSTLRISMNGDTSAEQGSTWSKSLILAGIPQINSNTSELFVPQMINLDILDGINFKKGCYTGQEIVARMHYLGKVKQRMFVCTINSSTAEAQVGDKIFNDQALSKSAGQIASIRGEKILAVLRTESAGSGSYYLDENTAITIDNPQPYSLENNQK